MNYNLSGISLGPCAKGLLVLGQEFDPCIVHHFHHPSNSTRSSSKKKKKKKSHKF